MKYILYIILLVLSVNTQAQQYEVNLYQDLLLLTSIDHVGNTPPTLDAVLKGKIMWKYFHLSGGYERAELAQPYNRATIAIGGHYNWKMLEVSQDVNYGLIVRPFSTTWSYGADSELAIIIKHRFKIIGLLQVTQRTEWGDLIRWSTFIGIGYKFK
jgi:hypothetical protein